MVKLGTLAVALSVAIMLIAISVVVGFKLEIRQKVMGFSAPIQVVQHAENELLESSAVVDSDSFRQFLLQYPFVEKVYPFAQKAGILKSTEGLEGVVLKGVTAEYDFTFLSENLDTGALPNVTDNNSRDILLSKKLAAQLKLRVGDEPALIFVQEPVVTKKVRVVGIYATGLEEIDNRFLVCPLALLRNVNEWSDSTIGGYEVGLARVVEDSLVDWANTMRYNMDYDMNAYAVNQRYPQIFDWLRLLDMNIVIIIILMVVVAIVNMVTVILILILERSQMVGILQSMGMAPSSVRKVFVYHVGWFIITGMAIGNLLGLGILWLEDTFSLISISPETYYISQIPIAYTWGYFALINLGTFLICMLSMYVPAYMATKIKPVKALRYQ